MEDLIEKVSRAINLCLLLLVIGGLEQVFLLHEIRELRQIANSPMLSQTMLRQIIQDENAGNVAGIIAVQKQQAEQQQRQAEQLLHLQRQQQSFQDQLQVFRKRLTATEREMRSWRDR